jgi:hypothetical protein
LQKKKLEIGQLLLRKSINSSLKKADPLSNAANAMSIILPFLTSNTSPMIGQLRRLRPFLICFKKWGQDGLKYLRKSKAGKFIL